MDDHDGLIDAIAAKDGPRAAEVMATHLDRVRDQMVAALQGRPITALEGGGTDAKAQVKFKRHGEKWLALAVAKLQAVE